MSLRLDASPARQRPERNWVPSWVLVAFALGAAVALPASAHACSYPPELPWQVDSAQVGVDILPPASPQVEWAGARRGKGSVCEANGSCVVSSCGDWGNVLVDLKGESGSAQQEELGYRLRLVEGNVPTGFEAVLRQTKSSASSLLWRGSFEEVVALDATFQLIAIDRAGNESEGSEPFEVAFDGCTRSFFDSEGCLEERLPPGTVISAEEPVMLGTQASGCGMAPASPDGGSWPAQLLVVGWVGLVLGRRSAAHLSPG